jgi:Ca2+-binding RTX toxin-like protein
MSGDGELDSIGDFQLGVDCIDVSSWGPIDDFSDLCITSTATGARISFGGEVLLITSIDRAPIAPDGLHASDFVDFGGGPQSFQFVGTAGNDFLIGTTGNDIFVVSAGADTIDGGERFDILDLSAATSGQFVSLEAPERNVGLGAGQTYLDVEGVIGSLASDMLIGDSVDNRLEGRDGMDILSGGAGDDSLFGGSDMDILYGGGGADVLNGGIGLDGVSYRDATSGVIADMVLAYSNRGEAAGDRYVDVEQLEGSGFSDTLRGDAQQNRIAALNGNDRLEGRAGNDYLDGGRHGDTLDGGSGDDTMLGGSENDTYFVGSIGDRVFETTSTSSITDAGGHDTVMSAVSFNLSAYTGVRFVEGLILTGMAAINGTGNGLANTLVGNAGNNFLNGGAGNDTLNGSVGNDTLLGGSGNDTYFVASSSDWVFETTTTSGTLDAGGMDTVLSAVSLNLSAYAGIRFVEGLVLTGTSAINGTGNGLANTLIGNIGNNVLKGGAGHDTLNGGSGSDTMLGGAGNDTYVVSSTGDRVFETTTTSSTTDAGGTDTVQSGVSFNLNANAGVRFVEKLTLTGTAAINGTGNALSNTLTGNSGNNVLNGAGGNDVLNGGSGSDTMLGGSGNDTYVVGAAGDRVFETTTTASTTDAGGIDTVQSSVTFGLDAYAGVRFVEKLTLTGTASINGTGNALANTIGGNSGNNVLNGSGGNDTINAGSGNDRLIGGTGNDVLTGGQGADSFIFVAGSNGVDVIADFNQLNGGGEEGDVLRFAGLGIGTFAYLGDGAFSGGSNNSEARVSGNQVLVDTNGDGVTDISIVLTGLVNASQLSADDFLFV